MKLLNLHVNTDRQFDWSSLPLRPIKLPLVINWRFSSFIIPAPGQGRLGLDLRSLFRAIVQCCELNVRFRH